MLYLLYPFNDPANFIFPSNIIDVSLGGARLKDLRDSDISIYDNFTNALKNNWVQDGLSRNRTLSGGAVISSDILDLTDVGGLASVVYDASGMINPQKFTIVQNFIPNYTGNPAMSIKVAEVSKFGSNNNKFQFFQQSASDLRFYAWSNTGSLTVSGQGMGTYNFTAGQKYKIVLKINFESGSENQALYIYNSLGVLVHSNTGNTRACVRDSSLTALDQIVLGNLSNHSVERFCIFPEVITPNDFDIDTLSDTKYTATDPSVEIDDKKNIDGLEFFEDKKTEPSSTAVKWNVKKDTLWLYESGGNFVASDGSLAQSSIDSEIDSAKANYTSIDARFGARAILHSPDGEETPELTELLVGYNFSADDKSNINKCIVWNYAEKVNGNVDLRPIKIELVSRVSGRILTNVIGKAGNIGIIDSQVKATVDDRNIWEVALYNTDQIRGDVLYKFTFPNNTVEYRKVPNQETENYNNLTEE